MHKGSRLIIVVVQVRSSENTMEEQWRHSGKRKEGMKLSLPPKLLEKN
jgi:hypothetical protein